MKIATIGTSFITDMIMGMMLEYPENSYEAIYTRTYEKANKLKEKYHVEKVYTDLSEMLKDDEIDTVYIASPNALHAKQAIQVMRAGKNAIVEKAFASNAKEAEEMIKVSHETGTFLFEAITSVNNPNFFETKKIIEKIGPVHFLECNYSKYSRKYDAFVRGENPNLFNPEFSAGALMDLNTYNLHFVVGLFGMPTEVTYHAHLEENGIDTSGVIVLTYPDLIAICITSKNTVAKNIVQIQGENGTIFVNSDCSSMRDIKVIMKDKETYNFDLQDRPISHYYYMGEITRIVHTNDRQKAEEKIQHTLNVMKVVDMAKESAGLVFAADKE